MTIILLHHVLQLCFIVIGNLINKKFNNQFEAKRSILLLHSTYMYMFPFLIKHTFPYNMQLLQLQLIAILHFFLQNECRQPRKYTVGVGTCVITDYYFLVIYGFIEWL